MSAICEWERCRRRVTHVATWPDGKEGRYCIDHARGVAWSHKKDLMPYLNAQQKAGVMAAGERFREQMQRLVKKGGITGVSIKAGNSDWITVAGKPPSSKDPA